MQEVVTLPTWLSKSTRGLSCLQPEEIKRTGVALNQVTIATSYAAFREKQGLPGDDSHKNWFSENSVWLAALWKRASRCVRRR